MSTIDFQYINRFRKSERDSKESVTNYRIAGTDSNTEQKIYGGVFCVPDIDYTGLLNRYCKDVLEKGSIEFLTEAQLLNNGPILVDLDFRFPYETEERQYTKEHLTILIESYIEELSRIFDFDESSIYKIYVLEKKTVNRIPEKNVTKDGIHFIIGISAEREMQILLRSRMVNKLKNLLSDLPITNPWEDVLDSGISNGKNHWQMYGSTKPSCEPYSLTHIYTVGYDPTDRQPSYDCRSTEDPDWSPKWSVLVHELSARYRGHPIFSYRGEFIRELNKIESSCSRKVKLTNNNQTNYKSSMTRFTNDVLNVRNKEEFDSLLEQFIEENTEQGRLKWNEITWHALALPEKYYGPYSQWVMVGMALKHTAEDLFISWIGFSAKSPQFNFDDIDKYKEKWDSFEWREEGITAKSIAYWCKAEEPKRYREIKTQCAEMVLNRVLGGYEEIDADARAIDRKGTTDVDLAEVLHSMFSDDYVCVDIKSNKWYQFFEPRWVQIDAGVGLRNEITSKLRALYTKKLMEYFALSETIPEDEDKKQKKVKKYCEKLAKVCERLGSTSDINNIMTEARHKFHDPDFEKKLDENPYLICFKNGVLDFRATKKEDLFRRGAPDDYLTKCTNIDYVPINETVHGPIIREIHDFMHKLFPDPNGELCEYMWNHLAATMTGLIAELQTFNIYIGGGQNGKSVLVKLMDLVLGEYKGTVPVNMLTDRRGKVGSATPEIMELKGARMAVAQEPQKGEKINEGVIKEFSSGEDELQGRHLYSNKMIKFMPQFNLVICTNYLPEIEGNDHGIWRRVRVVNFKSRFTDNPVDNDPEAPYQFLIDRSISKRMETWKEVFASMLADRAFKNKGRVPDCAEVISARDAYRKSQDCIAEFMSDRIIVDATSSISKTELNAEFKNWYENAYGRKGGPNAKDVHAEMDKKFKKNGKVWVGVRISYESDMQGFVDDNDLQEPNDL
jgi:P4 family phage/plasmid primase-like protien